MFFSRAKFLAMAACMTLFFLVVIGRLAYLQLVRGREYARFSDAYTVKEIPITAPRGNLYDRKGRVIATTRPSFNLLLNLSKAKKLDELLERVAPFVEKTPEELKEAVAQAKGQPRFRPVNLVTDLSREQVAKLQMRKTLATEDTEEGRDFSALEIRVEPIRHYEEGEMWGHVVGYLREISEEKLKEAAKSDPGKYFPGDVVGAQGIERRFDVSLRGRDGKQEAVVDALGHEVREDTFGLKKELLLSPPVAGDNYYLTLDRDLQKVAYDALKDKEGALVMLDVKTGEVLAMVSRPSYDPEKLVGNISRAYWVTLNTDERKILLNRTMQAAYPPGSTFKIITGLAALAEGVIKPTDKISCPGYYEVGGRRFGCWLGKGHGPVDFYRALVQSCDVYFYKVGEKVGIDRIAQYAKLFGLGGATGIEMDFERSGLIPTTEWKKKNRKEDWNAGETLSASIGQGYDLVTPLQNALMIARVASRGKEVKPTLVREIEHPDGRRERLKREAPSPIEVGLDQEKWDALIKALTGVVQDPGGTAHRIALKGITMGGKTGTAQVIGYDKFGRKARSKKTEDHAWFVAFAPAEDPEIAVAVVVEHGGHGGTAAAPVAQAAIQKYFEENGKLAPQNGTVTPHSPLKSPKNIQED
ncbi:MAG: penicillin-binding protein 2 [bacterium]